MTLAQLGFALLSAVTLAGALGAVTLKNVSHAVLSLVLFFVGVAALYFTLRADFIGVVQLLVYVGAVAVLIVFAIVLTRGTDGGVGPNVDALLGRGARGAGAMAAGAVGALLVFVVLRASPERAAQHEPPTFPDGGGVTAKLGEALMTTWTLPFEVASVLLTAALVGAIIIAMDEVRR